MDPTLLTNIINACKANATAQSPAGFCYRPATERAAVQALVAGGMLEAGQENNNGIPVRPTSEGLRWHAGNEGVASHTPNTAPAPRTVPQHAQVVIEDNIPMPESKRAGFAPREGGSLVDQYGFAGLQVGQSFFVPQSAGTDQSKPVHRTFSSVVSQANRKLHPMNFAIREVDETSLGRGKGARVWRIQDMQGERPVRARKPKDQPAQSQQPSQGGVGASGFPQQHMPAPPGPPAGTQPIPGVDFNPGFNGGFEPPASGFGQPFGGGFDQPAGGFMPPAGGPSFNG